MHPKKVFGQKIIPIMRDNCPNGMVNYKKITEL